MTWRLGLPHPDPLPEGEGGKGDVIYAKPEQWFLFANAGRAL